MLVIARRRCANFREGYAVIWSDCYAKVVATLLFGFITGINARNQRGLT